MMQVTSNALADVGAVNIHGADASQQLLQIARSYCAAGLSVIPIKIDGSKAPAIKWKQYQSRIADDQELQQWFGGPPEHGIGIVCGRVSGAAEVIDFDDPALFEPWCKVVQDADAGDLLQRLVEVETPSGGRHIVYRCPDLIDGNEKLAMSAEPDPVTNKDTLIETRGEGGFIVAAGSPAGCHGLYRPYVVLRGSLIAIPNITTEERQLLLTAARSFNRKHKPVREFAASSQSGDRPGDEFNRTATWDLLKAHGWTEVSSNGEVTYWCRPGKANGISATTGHEGHDVLYVFSSNAHPFEANRGYSKFTAYALLDHDGNFEAAAKALAPNEKPKTDGGAATKPKLDDIGNAERLARQFGHDVVWISEFGKWFIWTGSRWEDDTTEQILGMSKKVARSIFNEVRDGKAS